MCSNQASIEVYLLFIVSCVSVCVCCCCCCCCCSCCCCVCVCCNCCCLPNLPPPQFLLGVRDFGQNVPNVQTRGHPIKTVSGADRSVSCVSCCDLIAVVVGTAVVVGLLIKGVPRAPGCSCTRGASEPRRSVVQLYRGTFQLLPLGGAAAPVLGESPLKAFSLEMCLL